MNNFSLKSQVISKHKEIRSFICATWSNAAWGVLYITIEFELVPLNIFSNINEAFRLHRLVTNLNLNNIGSVQHCVFLFIESNSNLINTSCGRCCSLFISNVLNWFVRLTCIGIHVNIEETTSLILEIIPIDPFISRWFQLNIKIVAVFPSKSNTEEGLISR